MGTVLERKKGRNGSIGVERETPGWAEEVKGEKGKMPNEGEEKRSTTRRIDVGRLGRGSRSLIYSY